MKNGRNAIIAIVSLVFSSNIVCAQQDSASSLGGSTSNRIGFDVGFNNGYLKDRNFSPLNYKEKGALFSIHYIRKKPERRNVFTVDIDFSSGTIKSEATDFFNADYILGSVELSLLWRLARPKNEKLSFFAGPQYNSFIQYVDWNGQESWTYLATHGLALKGFLQYKPSAKRCFYTSLSIPVFQLLVRPPYNGFDLYIQEHSEEILKLAFRGELASFNKYVGVDWKTVYQYTMSKHVDFTLNYVLRYQRVSGYNALIHLQNQLTAGFTIKF